MYLHVDDAVPLHTVFNCLAEALVIQVDRLLCKDMGNVAERSEENPRGYVHLLDM